MSRQCLSSDKSGLHRPDAAVRAVEPASKGLRLAGMHKLSTIDYPGLISAVVFTQGCNFYCPYCHNAHLIPRENRAGGLGPDEALAFLDKRKDVLDGLVISGGEPTLQEGLADFCKAVRALGYAVKLDSNGSRPDVLENLLERSLVDYVALDCKTAPREYCPAMSPHVGAGGHLRRSADIVRASGVAHEFRTTCVAPFVDAGHIEAMAELVADSPWYLQRARLDISLRDKGLYPLSAEEMDALVQRAAELGAAAVIR